MGWEVEVEVKYLLLSLALLDRLKAESLKVVHM